MTSKYFASVLLFTLSPLALAGEGGSVGNGGNAVVCKDADGKILSVSLMDLWEGRNDASPNRLGGGPLNIPSSSEPVDQQIERAIKRMNLGKDLEDYFRDELSYVKTRFKGIPSNMSLMPVPEIMPLFQQDGCEFKLLANYFPSIGDSFGQATIKFDSKLRDLLDKDPTNEAALLIHETLYKMSRDFADASDSVLVRKIVALAFSDQYDLVWLKIFMEEALDLRNNPIVVLSTDPTQQLRMFLKYETESSKPVRVGYKVTDAHEQHPMWTGCSLTPGDSLIQCSHHCEPAAADPYGACVPLMGFLSGWPAKGMTVSVTLSGVAKIAGELFDTPSYGRVKLDGSFPGPWASYEFNFEKKKINFHLR